MRTASIERSQLKKYVPTFTIPTTPDNESDTIIVVSEMSDEEMLPIVKLLHSVYIQSAA